jgi:hypothetical protein
MGGLRKRDELIAEAGALGCNVDIHTSWVFLESMMRIKDHESFSRQHVWVFSELMQAQRKGRRT